MARVENHDSPVITVQRRRDPEDFWVVWVDQAIAGSVHSRQELEEFVADRGGDPALVFYEPGAKEQLDGIDSLPPGNRRR